jgi:hypothetical protein
VRANRSCQRLGTPRTRICVPLVFAYELMRATCRL